MILLFQPEGIFYDQMDTMGFGGLGWWGCGVNATERKFELPPAKLSPTATQSFGESHRNFRVGRDRHPLSRTPALALDGGHACALVVGTQEADSDRPTAGWLDVGVRGDRRRGGWAPEFVLRQL